jgi:hypothetical protein
MSHQNLVPAEMATAAAALVGRRGDPVISLAIPDWGRLARLGRLGVLRGEVTRSRIFVPTGNAADPLHVVTSIIERGRIVDYVAFRPDHPVVWGRRIGFANVLVSPSIERAWPFLRRPLALLTLHRRPIDWLRAGRQGACVVNWRSLDTGSILGLREIGQISVPDGGIARRLAEALTRPHERPDIEIERPWAAL